MQNRKPAVNIRSGDTVLHKMVRDNMPVNVIKEFIEKNSEKTSEMARTVNDDGHLPIDVILFSNSSSASESYKVNVMNLLIDACLAHYHKPLSEQVSFENVVKNHGVTDSASTLYQNMKLGCEIVNAIRARNVRSATHPDANKSDNNVKKQLISELEALNKSYLSAKTNIVIADGSTDEKLDKLLKASAKLTREKNIGDCFELSLEAWETLREIEKNNSQPHRLATLLELSGNAYHDLNADHVIFVMDFPGPNAVVLDVHEGKVYPYTEEAKKKELCGFRAFDTETLKRYVPSFKRNQGESVVNTATIFNPKYHQLDIKNLIPKPLTTMQKLACFGIFGAVIAIGATTYTLMQSANENDFNQSL